MKHLLFIVIFLCSTYAVAFDGLARFDFQVPRSPYSSHEPSINFVLVVPARFPASSERIGVSLVCGRGVMGREFSRDQLHDRWPEWVDAYQPVITRNSISFGGFTFGCDRDWYFVEAPTLDELMSAFYRLGSLTGRIEPVSVWGYGRRTDDNYALPAPSLVVSTLPFQESLGYGVGLVLPLRSPLTPVVYNIQQYGQSRTSRAPAATTLSGTVVGVRQGGDLVPLVFENRISSVPISTSRPFELVVATPHGLNVTWEHLLIDTNNARLAYRFSTDTISLDPVPETVLAELAAGFDAAATPPAEPEPDTSAEAVEPEPEPEPEIELVEVQVQAGENLWVIAERHGVTVDEIVRINCLPDPYVNPGTRIKIPPTDQEIAPRCG